MNIYRINDDAAMTLPFTYSNTKQRMLSYCMAIKRLIMRS